LIHSCTKLVTMFFKDTVQQVLITLHCKEPFFEIFLDSNFKKNGQKSYKKRATSEAEELGKVGARHWPDTAFPAKPGNTVPLNPHSSHDYVWWSRTKPVQDWWPKEAKHDIFHAGVGKNWSSSVTILGSYRVQAAYKWPKVSDKTKGVFHLTTQNTFTCIGADHTNGGVKFSILSQSIPWCFSGPSLLQTVQLVLLTKANVKGHIYTNRGRFGFVGRGQIYRAPHQVTEANGVDGLSEQWLESRSSQLQL